MIRSILLVSLNFSLMFSSFTYADKSLEKVCAGYKKFSPFQTDIALGSLDVNYDMTGDNISDKTNRWGKYGTVLTIDCENGKTYSPIYSYTGIWASPAEKEKWSNVELSKHINTASEEAKSGANYFTWIDNKLYSFDILPFISDLPEQWLEARDIPIYFDGNQYTTDLGYCKAFDLFAPRYKIGPINPKDPDIGPTHLTLILKSNQYRIIHKGQSTHDYGAFKPTDINQDGIEDGYLDYWERYGRGAQEFLAPMLGCGDGTYFYVPDHQVEKIIERGKQVDADKN